VYYEILHYFFKLKNVVNVFLKYFLKSEMDASHPEILFLYTAIVHAAPQETVRDAGIEPGTAALLLYL
jgi:hypothetical protein